MRNAKFQIVTLIVLLGLLLVGCGPSKNQIIDQPAITETEHHIYFFVGLLISTVLFFASRRLAWILRPEDANWAGPINTFRMSLASIFFIVAWLLRAMIAFSVAVYVVSLLTLLAPSV